MIASSPAQPASRGRPRDARADLAIAEAVQALLAERGYAALTMESVALRARVGKATVYRRWRSKAEMVFGCLVHDRDLVAPDTGSLQGDLTAVASSIVADLSGPAVARAMPGLLADLEQDRELRERFDQTSIHSESVVVATVFDRAAQRGELARPADIGLAHALLLGTAFGWLFLLDRPATEALGPEIARMAAAAFGHQPA